MCKSFLLGKGFSLVDFSAGKAHQKAPTCQNLCVSMNLFTMEPLLEKHHTTSAIEGKAVPFNNNLLLPTDTCRNIESPATSSRKWLKITRKSLKNWLEKVELLSQPWLGQKCKFTSNSNLFTCHPWCKGHLCFSLLSSPKARLIVWVFTPLQWTRTRGGGASRPNAIWSELPNLLSNWSQITSNLPTLVLANS